MALKSEPSVIYAILMSDVSLVEQGTQKRSLVGCFDQILVPSFPGRYSGFWVTAWIANIVGTLTEMELTCRIQEKSGGHVVFSSSTKVEFQGEHAFNNTNTIAFNTAVQNIVFPRGGIYTIVILLNGEETGVRDFNVITPPKP